MHENSGLDPAGAGGGIPAKARRGGAMEHKATRRAMRGRKPKSSLGAVLASASAISSHRSPVAAPSEESIERHSGARQPNSGVPEFGHIIVQVGNSRPGRRKTGISRFRAGPSDHPGMTKSIHGASCRDSAK